MAGLVGVDEQLAQLAEHTQQLDDRLDRITELLERPAPKP